MVTTNDDNLSISACVSEQDKPEVLAFVRHVFRLTDAEIPAHKPINWYKVTESVRTDPMMLLAELPDVYSPKLFTVQSTNDPVSSLFDCFGGVPSGAPVCVARDFRKRWPFWYDASSFIYDGLMCDNAYVIDFDKQCLEYYVGDFRSLHQQNNRYSNRIIKEFFKDLPDRSDADMHNADQRATGVCKLLLQLDFDYIRKRVPVYESVHLMEAVQKRYHSKDTTKAPELDVNGNITVRPMAV